MTLTSIKHLLKMNEGEQYMCDTALQKHLLYLFFSDSVGARASAL